MKYFKYKTVIIKDIDLDRAIYMFMHLNHGAGAITINDIKENTTEVTIEDYINYLEYTIHTQKEKLVAIAKIVNPY